MNRGSVQRQGFKIPAQQLGSYAEITALADAISSPIGLRPDTSRTLYFSGRQGTDRKQR